MLVAAFSRLKVMRRAYAHAIAAGYRFYSYGDAVSCRSPARHMIEKMAKRFAFRLLATDGRRASAKLQRRTAIPTPAFMPVGMQGADEGRALARAARSGRRCRARQHLSSDAAAGGGAHRPRSGACTPSLNWPYPILTDFGGFQVMSLAELRKVEERGMTFRSHVDGAMIELTPERAIEVQRLLGADIAMQLDECARLPCGSARDRAGDAPLAALGGARQARL